MSHFIPDEGTLTSEERKHTKLPCGFTLAQSWAALRKSWLGFDIAHSRGNLTLMTHYASIIRKLQKQMGIQLTKFDADILDKQALNEADEEREADQGRTQLKEDEAACTPDYDAIMGAAQKKVNCGITPTGSPRREIFGTEARTSSPRLRETYSTQKRREQSPELVITDRGRRACVYRSRPRVQQEEVKRSQPYEYPNWQKGQNHEDVEDEIYRIRMRSWKRTRTSESNMKSSEIHVFMK